MLGLGLGIALGLGLRLGFELSSPIVRELILRLTRLSFPLVRFRHNPEIPATFWLLPMVCSQKRHLNSFAVNAVQ